MYTNSDWRRVHVHVDWREACTLIRLETCTCTFRKEACPLRLEACPLSLEACPLRLEGLILAPLRMTVRMAASLLRKVVDCLAPSLTSILVREKEVSHSYLEQQRRRDGIMEPNLTYCHVIWN